MVASTVLGIPLMARLTNGSAGLLPSPALRERCHRSLARRSVAVGWGPILVVPKGERPKPGRINRRGCCLHDAADDDAIGKRIEIILFPLA